MLVNNLGGIAAVDGSEIQIRSLRLVDCPMIYMVL